MSEFPSFDLGGQVALVTGAARGLGSAISKALAHAGADIVLGLRDVKTGDQLAREIGSLGRKVLKLQLDVTKLDQIEPALKAAIALSENSTFWSTTPHWDRRRLDRPIVSTTPPPNALSPPQNDCACTVTPAGALARRQLLN